MTTATKIPTFENLGSLITYKDAVDGEVIDRCLGNLVHFEGHGVYDADLGRVDISPEDAKTHNELYDTALLEGLDNRCEINQCGTFYLRKKDGHYEVRTFLSTLVSDVTRRNGRNLEFDRGGKTFRGQIRKQDDMFNFRRVK